MADSIYASPVALPEISSMLSFLSKIPFSFKSKKLNLSLG
jgi:hypothetical protein